MVHVTDLIQLVDVNLPDCFIDFIGTETCIRIPVLIDESVDFKRFKYAIEVGHTLFCHCCEVFHELKHSIVLVVLALKVEIHHFGDESESIFE